MPLSSLTFGDLGLSHTAFFVLLRFLKTLLVHSNGYLRFPRRVAEEEEGREIL